jgi:hypothetical protein
MTLGAANRLSLRVVISRKAEREYGRAGFVGHFIIHGLPFQTVWPLCLIISPAVAMA